MDLTSRQQNELHIAIYEYLRQGHVFKPAAQVLMESSNAVLRFLMTEQARGVEVVSLLEKQWQTVSRLQRKINNLENRSSHSASQVEPSIADESHKLDVAIYSYLKKKSDNGSQKACAYMLAADSSLEEEDFSGNNLDLQTCWTKIPIVQKTMYDLDAPNRKGREGTTCKPDKFSKDDFLLSRMERSLVSSKSGLLSTSDSLNENEIHDKHRSAIDKDGALLEEYQHNSKSNTRRRVCRPGMFNDQPTPHKMLSAIPFSGLDAVQKAFLQQNSYLMLPDNIFDEGKHNVVVHRSAALANEVNVHENEGPYALQVGKSVFYGMQSDGEGYGENIMSNESHKCLDEKSSYLHRGLRVTLEYDDQAIDHTDGSLPSLLSHNHGENRTKHSVPDPFAIREGNTLSWENMSMTVNKSKRKVLDNCSGKVPKHQMTVIMGKSGSGKSTILNILSGRQQSNHDVGINADIFLDDYTIDPTNMAIRRSIAFVAQDDSLVATSTPRDAIRFSAKMRLPRATTGDELDQLTARMLEELGLRQCADSLVGGPLIKGISGGERKRTSVGIELVTMPSIVCLDEPTSGLDAFSALQCCEVLRKVANAGASVLFTIHQPSSEIFEIFNHLILMNGGRVMYQGSVQNMSTFFGARGHPVPRNYNPADWCIDVAQGISMEELIDAGYFVDSDRILHTHRKSIWCVPDQDSISFLAEVVSLFEREVLNMRRDWTVVFTRVFVMGILSFFIGLIFFDIGSADKLDAFSLHSQFGAMMVILITCMMSSVQLAMFVYPEQRPIFLREYSTSHYSVFSYLTAHFASEAILIALKVFIVVTIIHFMVGLSGSYATYILLTFTLSMSITAQATCVACLGGDNVKLATQLMPLLFQPQLLFSGFFLSPDLMPKWLSHVQLACTMTYATRILVVEEFYECSSDPKENEACQRMLDNTRSDPDEVWVYWLVLAGSFVFFKILAILLLQQSAKKFY